MLLSQQLASILTVGSSEDDHQQDDTEIQESEDVGEDGRRFHSHR